MFVITELAQQKIAELVNQSEKPVTGLRVRARALSPLKVDYKLAFISPGQEEPQDAVSHFTGFDVFVDPDSTPHVDVATLDYVDSLMGSGFKIERPRSLPPELSGSVAERVMELIDEQINPAVAGHGGVISLLDVKDNIVYVQLGGGCQGCSRANITLKQGIETTIKEAIPEVVAVYDVTDHANGQNPYYREQPA